MKIFSGARSVSSPNADGGLLAFGGYTCSMEILFSDLPELLRDLRKRSGETLEQVAQGSGLSFRSVWGYETGETKPPVHKLAAVLAHFGISTFADLQRAHDAMRGIVERPRDLTVAQSDKDEIINILLGSIRELKRSSTGSEGP